MTIKNLGEKVGDLEESVHGLTSATDGLSKSVYNLKIEYSAMSTQLSRHDQ